jgi:hypothetical protein
MFKTKIFISFILLLLFAWPDSTEAQSVSVCLTQVQITGGEGKTQEDFIELYNPSSAPVNLNGYRLVKRTQSTSSKDTLIKSWTSDTFVQPGSFYLWANVNFTAIAVLPDVTTSLTISNDNGVALRNGSNDTGEVVDSASWGNAENSFTKVSAENPTANMALQRNNCSGSWSVGLANPRNSTSGATNTTPSTTSTTTPVVNPTTPSPSIDTGGVANLGFVKNFDIKLSEVFPNPEGEDEGKEQIEIENTGSLPVNLDGYLLQDKTESGPKSNSFRIDGLILPAKSVYSFVLPKGRFVLNNTKGDEVNLYFPDKTLADKVVYLEDAKEGWSWQKVGSVWQWQLPSLGKKNEMPTEAVVYQTTNLVATSSAQNATNTFFTLLSFVNEILANPKGADEGKEWVEFFNPSDQTENLKNFILDDSGEGLPSSNAWVLPDTVLAPQTYVVLTIPEDKFALNNSGKEAVRLFTPDKKLLKTIEFADAEEDSAYAFTGSGWKFNVATPWKDNNFKMPEIPSIKFWEILPNPGPEEDEFIELKNLSASTTALTGFYFRMGKKTYELEEGLALPALGFLTLATEDINLRLNNGGQKLELFDNYDRLVDTVTYPKTKKNLAWAYVNNGFVWSAKITPGEENTFTQVNTQNASIELKADNSIKLKTQNQPLPENQELPINEAGFTEAVLGLSTTSASSTLAEVQYRSNNFKFLWLGLFGLCFGLLGFLFWKMGVFTKFWQV